METTVGYCPYCGRPPQVERRWHTALYDDDDPLDGPVFGWKVMHQRMVRVEELRYRCPAYHMVSDWASPGKAFDIWLDMCRKADATGKAGGPK